MESLLPFTSMILALHSGYVTLEILLKYLTLVPITDETMVAYRHACLYSLSNQYVDNIHFLSLVQTIPEYGAIYILSQGDMTVPKELNKECKSIQSSLIHSLVQLQCNRAFRVKMKTLSGSRRNVLFRCFLDLCIQGRNLQILDYVDTNDHAETFVMNDYLDSLIISGDVLSLINKRIEYLQTIYPDFWSHAAQPYYQRWIKRALDLYHDYKREDLWKLYSLMPNVVDPRILSLSDRSFYMYGQPRLILAYILGYPLHLGTPTLDTLVSSLVKLDALGLKEYAKNIGAKPPNLDYFGPVEACNLCDTLGKKIKSYSSFDVVWVIKGKHAFAFTRPEFKTVIESGINHWTGEHLCLSQLVPIHFRVLLSDGLPTPGTIKSLLKRDQWIPERTIAPPDIPEDSLPPQQDE